MRSVSAVSRQRFWMNTTEDGQARYSVVFSCLYRDGDQWKSDTQLRPQLTSCSSPRLPISRTPGSRRFVKTTGPRPRPRWKRRHKRVGRFDIREATAIDRRPEPGRGLRPGRSPERPGHRRNYDPGREKHAIKERINAAVADVSHYRVVALLPTLSKSVSGATRLRHARQSIR